MILWCMSVERVLSAVTSCPPPGVPDETNMPVYLECSALAPHSFLVVSRLPEGLPLCGEVTVAHQDAEDERVVVGEYLPAPHSLHATPHRFYHTTHLPPCSPHLALA